MIKHRTIILILFVIAVVSAVLPFRADGQTKSEREVAARFAPIFYQALGENPRSDYLTNFDFDGDWRGDNNWANAENKKFPLRAYIYYSVSETRTHFFIHYAVFHPRDYKGGEHNGLLLSQILRQGALILGDRDPTGMIDETSVAHENDMEGALVVVAKNGSDRGVDRVAFVETLRHNSFVSYTAGDNPSGFGGLKTFGDRVLLHIEPKGHGIESFAGTPQQTQGKQFIVYHYTGNADDPEVDRSGSVGYELVPIQTTLWPKARTGAKIRETTYGASHDYSSISISLESANGRVVNRRVLIGIVGSAFSGKIGGVNMARPPWGWFDSSRREDPLGMWFFDPAGTIKRNFALGESFSSVYLRLPFWAVK